MFYQKTVKYFLIFSFLSFLLFSNSLKAEITVDNEWARVTPSGAGSVYMKIINTGNSDDKLISASSDNQSTILPLPSSPHCEPTTTIFFITP